MRPPARSWSAPKGAAHDNGPSGEAPDGFRGVSLCYAAARVRFSRGDVLPDDARAGERAACATRGVSKDALGSPATPGEAGVLRIR